MVGRMWIYPELRFILAHQYKLDADEIAVEVNGRFHGGADVRTQHDINKVLRGRNIVNRRKRERRR